MFAKIKHLAIVSENPALQGEFYGSLFGMRKSRSSSPGEAVVVRDGYVGLNINPRAPGRQAGLDHFGFEVAEVGLVCSRIRDGYPSIKILERPSNRPFAGMSTHDPAGNVFDLSQPEMGNRRDLYVEEDWSQDRHIKHFALRAVDSERVARFYRDVFELTELEKPADDPNSYLSDGRVTLVIFPWKITDYEGSGIERPALDHIGFRVESAVAFKRDLDALVERNPALTPRRARKEPEGQARLNLFSKCPYGRLHLSDPDGVLIDVAEG
ncbi:MAG: VOC family protein [Deltaproteobacteria bacterium]|nr:VOC family protein [Deltaproteobacteria bacterium]